MENALRVLQNVARRDGFTLSFEPIVSLEAQPRAHLVSMATVSSAMPIAEWLAESFEGVANVYLLSPDLPVKTLKEMRRAVYQSFQLTPKEFSDAVKAANLLAKMRAYKLPNVNKLVMCSGASCYAVFKAFVWRVFHCSPADVFQYPDAALALLEARLPILATALVNHFTMMLQQKTDAKNEQALFLAFLREKPTHKTNSQNQLTKFLTPRD